MIERFENIKNKKLYSTKKTNVNHLYDVYLDNITTLISKEKKKTLAICLRV